MKKLAFLLTTVVVSTLLVLISPNIATANAELVVKQMSGVDKTTKQLQSETKDLPRKNNSRKRKQSGKKNRKNGRTRNKNKMRRAKRLLRNEGSQISYGQGRRTLGLQWVIDIKQNLTTLMKGLEQVERQLVVVKEELKQKANMTGSTSDSKVMSTSDTAKDRPSVVCPWEMLDGGTFQKCYSFHRNDRRSWYQAAANCRVVGGRLLRISSPDETAFLLARAPAWMSSGSAWLTTTWTDGNRLYPCPSDGNNIWPSEKSWGWGTRVDRMCFDDITTDSTGSHPLKSYTDWLMSASPHEGACVALAVASAKWEALDCDRPAAYVCERDPIQSNNKDSNAKLSKPSDKIFAEQTNKLGYKTSSKTGKQYEASYYDEYNPIFINSQGV